MQLEVPADQYDKAVELMKKKIESGKVKGVVNMKKILCIMFGFAIGLIVGLLCSSLRTEEKKDDSRISCQNGENGESRKTLTAFGYI